MLLHVSCKYVVCRYHITQGPRNFVEVIKLVACAREVLGSYLGHYTAYSDRFFSFLLCPSRQIPGKYINLDRDCLFHAPSNSLIIRRPKSRHSTLVIHVLLNKWPIPVAARSKRRGTATTRLLGLRIPSPVGDTDVCLLRVLCVVR
jgi:hypothetical protein